MYWKVATTILNILSVLAIAASAFFQFKGPLVDPKKRGRLKNEPDPEEFNSLGKKVVRFSVFAVMCQLSAMYTGCEHEKYDDEVKKVSELKKDSTHSLAMEKQTLTLTSTLTSSHKKDHYKFYRCLS